MQMKASVCNLTGRAKCVMLVPDTFADERILSEVARVMMVGGVIDAAALGRLGVVRWVTENAGGQGNPPPPQDGPCDPAPF